MNTTQTLLLCFVLPAVVSAADFHVIATGLNNPRGLKFGPDGYLYVAEGGTGGSASTVGACEQVPAPIGPYTGGFTSRISRIDHHGNRSTVIGGLPSSQTNPLSGGFVSGVSDIAFLDGELYGLEAGAGCSHGLAGTANTVFRVHPNGTMTPIADLSAFIKSHPVLRPDLDDFEPDGTWYSMVAVEGALYLAEPNHQEIDRVSPGGQISRVADLSLMFPSPAGWQGPTSLAWHGNFFFGTLGPFPITVGGEGVYQLNPGGSVHLHTAGLTTVLGVTFDHRARMYVLEMSPAAGFPTPFVGRVRRVEPSGAATVIAQGLALPTALTMGPDGNLYVSNFGFGFPPGAGQVIRIDLDE